MTDRISRCYSQLTSIRNSLEDMLDETDENEEEYELLDSAVDSIGLAIDSLKQITSEGSATESSFILD